MRRQDIKAFCITLNPRDSSRAQKALEEIRKLGFRDPEFFQGVNGKKLSIQEVKNLTSPRGFYELHNGRYVHEGLSGLGSVGCYLSHLKMWRVCVSMNEPIAIFEDDFVARDGSSEVIDKALVEACNNNYDILRLQHRPNPDYGEKLEDMDCNHTAKVLRTEGTCAYIITPEASAKLIDTALPIEMQVDTYLDMASYYHQLNHLASKENIFVDPRVGSLVGHNELSLYQDGFHSSSVKRHKKCLVILTVLIIVFGVWLWYR